MGIAWIITTLIAIAGLTLAVATFRGRSAASFKRIHYTSGSFQLILPSSNATNADDFTPKARTVGHSENMIVPHVVILRIENTGRAAITPDDFQGPLNIDMGNLALFKHAVVKFNRAGILDAESTKISHRSHGHIGFSPMLLNPRDALTMICLVDGVVDVSVEARIAGVERIVTLPPPSDHGTHLEVTFKSFLYPLMSDWPEDRYVRCVIGMSPVLIEPSGDLLDQVEVRVAGARIDDPHLLGISLTVADGNPDLASISFGDNPLTLSLGNVTIRKVRLRRGDRYVSSKATREFVGWTASSVTVRPSILPHIAEGVSIDVYCEGDPSTATVTSTPNWLDNVFRMEMKHALGVEEHLAKMTPRFLLSNRRLYSAWQGGGRRLGAFRKNLIGKSRALRQYVRDA